MASSYTTPNVLSEDGISDREKLRQKLIKAKQLYCSELTAFHSNPPQSYQKARKTVTYYSNEIEKLYKESFNIEATIEDKLKRDIETLESNHKKELEILEAKFQKERAIMEAKIENVKQKLESKFSSELVSAKDKNKKYMEYLKDKLHTANETLELQETIKPKMLIKYEMNFNHLVDKWNENIYYGKCPIVLPPLNTTETKKIQEIIKQFDTQVEEEEKYDYIGEIRKKIEEEEKKAREEIQRTKIQLERDRKEKEDRAREEAFAISNAERIRKEQEDERRHREMRELELKNPEEYARKYLEPVKVKYESDNDSETDSLDDMSDSELKKEWLKSQKKKNTMTLQSLEEQEEELKLLRSKSIEEDIKEKANLQPKHYNYVIN
jgi:hypothetical protein